MSHDADKVDASPFRAWLELLRVPNLFTVPGDPIVGFLLASMGQAEVDLTCMIWPALSALLLYCAGLVSNDVFDLGEDRRDRPERPIPSGRISRDAAWTAAVVLIALGISMALAAGIPTVMVACALAVLILLYNAWLKRITLVGPLTMGLCRGFSLLLGASVFATGLTTPVVLVAAGGLTLYILGVTLIAAKETSGKRVGIAAWVPFVLVWCWLLAQFTLLRGTIASDPRLFAFALAIVAILSVSRWARAMYGASEPKRIAGGIGGFLRALLPIQGALAAFAIGPWAFICLPLWALAALTGRRFYAS